MKMMTLLRLDRVMALVVIVWLIAVQTAAAQLPEGFVYPQDTLFMKSNGSSTAEPYFFSGTNNYYMMYKPMNMVEDILDGMVCLNQKVVRMWFFMDGSKFHDGYNLQSAPYTYNEAGYQHLDSVMVELAERDLKCIPVFVNYWSDFGGMAQYAQWAGGSQADFYTNTQMKDIYKEYVRSWVTRTNSVTGQQYADDPTIFSWQLTNEGRSTSATVNAYVSWADEMSTFIKSLDSNHMVSMGDEGLMNYTYAEVNAINEQRAAEGKDLLSQDWQYAGGQGDWIGLLNLPNLDFGTVHNYATDNWSKDLEWGKIWTSYHIEVAHGMNKPCIMEEYDKAYQGTWNETKDQERAEVMTAYTDIIYNQHMAGDCSWMLIGVNYFDPPENGKTTDVEDACNTNVPVEDIWLYRDKWPGDGHQYSAYDPYTAPVLQAHGQRMLDKNIQAEPQAFALAAPNQGAVEVSVVPQISWNTSQYATSYELIISRNGDLTNPVLQISGIRSANYRVDVPDQLDYNTTYHWQVTASNYIGEQASNVHSFSTQSPPPPLGTFAAVAPGSQNIPVSGTVFSWDAAAHADYYILKVSANSDLSNPIINATALSDTNYTSNVVLDHATSYYWSVVAQNTLHSQTMDQGTLAFVTRLPSPTIDNFESYSTDSDILTAWVRNSAGDALAISLESGSISEGTQSMQLDYNFTSYAGATKQVDLNWTGYSGLSFWLQGDNSGHDLLLQFQEASGEYWESTIQIGGTQEVFIPFTAFANPSWGGAVNGQVDLHAIAAVSFYFGGAGGSGTVYIDDLKASIEHGGSHAPVANAGDDQVVMDGDKDGSENVALEGSASYDIDGSVVDYQWFEGGGLLASGASAQVSLPVGEHIILLEVTDNDGLTASDEVIVSVESPDNELPIANAGEDVVVADQDGNGSESILLDGSASADSDGQITSYTWIDAGVVVGTGVNLTIDLPVGEHTIQLQVQDNEGATAIDHVMVTVTDPQNNQAPVANAGSDVYAEDVDGNGKETVNLNGSASTDNDGTIVSFEWSQNGTLMTSGENVTLDLAIGTHIIELMVTDDLGASDTDEVRVTVTSPTASVVLEAEDANLTGVSINTDPAVSQGAFVSMEGTGEITWSVNVTTAGVQQLYIGYLLPYGNKTQALRVNGVNAGSVVFDGTTNIWLEKEVTVNLSAGLNTITLAKDWGYMYFDYLSTDQSGVNENTAPVANAGEDQLLTDVDQDGVEPATLNASMSSDPDGTIVSYAWSENGVEIGSGSLISHDFTVGNHVITLTVTDDGGAQSSDQVTIIVEAADPTPASVLEAEDASLINVTVLSEANASNGEYVYMEGNNGKITWTVDAPASGLYTLWIGYYLPYGEKIQHLNVNTAYVGTVSFGGATNVWQERAIEVNLNAGTNTVTLTANWGYMYFDYASVESAASRRGFVQDSDTPKSEVTIYPNPASEMLYILADDFVEAEITNLAGVTLLEVRTTEVDLSSLTHGVYLLRVKTHSEVRSLQVIVK